MPSTVDVIIRAKAEPAQASAGKRVRATSGTLTMNAKQTSATAPNGEPWLAFCPFSADAVTAKQIMAMSTSASSTRSNRPRTSRGERGGGGLVTPASRLRKTRSGSRLLMSSA